MSEYVNVNAGTSREGVRDINLPEARFTGSSEGPSVGDGILPQILGKSSIHF